LVLQHIVGYAQLDAIHRKLLAERPRKKNHGRAGANLIHNGKGVDPGPTFHAVIGDHNIEGFFAQLAIEILPRQGGRGLKIQA
jgi:hypothetical protein